MISRLILTAAITLFFTPAVALYAQEHPEHPKKTTEHPKKGAEAKQVSTGDISAGIKKHITTETNKGDGKFHVKHEGQDLALDLIKVHDDRLSDLGDGAVGRQSLRDELPGVPVAAVTAPARPMEKLTTSISF